MVSNNDIEVFKSGIEKNQFPRYLYKYWSVESALRFLGNHKIMFSQYTAFNDPFECASNVDGNNTLKEWKAFLASQGLALYEINKNLSNIKANKKVAEKMVQDSVKQTLLDSGIFCMTETPDNLLMWAHYADEHRGVCLKFDLLNDLDTFYFPKKVDYNQTYLQYNYLQNPSKASEAIWHKSSDWAYEKEYRIIKPTYHGLMDVNPDAFVGVIIGCRCDKVDEQKIKDAIANIPYKNVVLQHASLNHTKYCLDIK